MAENTQGRRRRRAASSDGETPAPAAKDTKRVVLARKRVIVLPDDISDDHASKLAKLVTKAVKDDEHMTGEAEVHTRGEAWLVVGNFDGDTKAKAIEAYAGKPNTPEAKPGAYKAPTVSAFAGGRLYERPPAPKVEVTDLD